jgi:hypothetical protein
MKAARTCILLFDGDRHVHDHEGGLAPPARPDRLARDEARFRHGLRAHRGVHVPLLRAVRDDLARVGYRIDVASEAGKCTRFTLCPR